MEKRCNFFVEFIRCREICILWRKLRYYFVLAVVVFSIVYTKGTLTWLTFAAQRNKSAILTFDKKVSNYRK